MLPVPCRCGGDPELDDGGRGVRLDAVPRRSAATATSGVVPVNEITAAALCATAAGSGGQRTSPYSGTGKHGRQHFHLKEGGGAGIRKHCTLLQLLQDV